MLPFEFLQLLQEINLPFEIQGLILFKTKEEFVVLEIRSELEHDPILCIEDLTLQ
jgi:hypothetical protein